MYYLTGILFILGETLPSRSHPSFANEFERNPNDTSSITQDCVELDEKDLTAGIWSLTFPDNLRELTIQNCDRFILNISTVTKSKPSFQFLTIRNVKHCDIVGCGNGAGFFGTSLPSHTTFANIESLSVNAPLYGEIQFAGGVLQFMNVTMTNLKPKSISLVSSSLKKFSITGSAVMMAEKEAITFYGSSDSLLEIKDSFFYSVGENFMVCNVTNAIIQKNRFVYAKEGSFLLNTTHFNSTGNTAFLVGNCPSKLFSEELQFGNSCNCTKNNSLKGKISVGSTTESMTRLIFKSKNVSTTDGKANETIPVTDSMYVADDTGEEGKVSIIFNRLGNRFFLLWFLALFLLLLMFPIAFFIKKLLCRVIDNAFPQGVKHKQLVNVEDI